MARLHAGLPENVLLVIDAAYAEYVTAKDYEAGLEMARKFPNVVMTRTFSKLYGLAGLRIGWMYASGAVCDVINRIRGPFNTSLMQQLVAAAALKDREHVWAAVKHNDQWLPWLTAEIRKTGLRVDDSVANFVLIHFPAQGEKTAARADAFLNQGGIILRAVASYGLPNALRLTVGTGRAEPAGGQPAQAIHGGVMDVQQDRHHRSGPDRLLHRPCGAPRRAGQGNLRPRRRSRRDEPCRQDRILRYAARRYR